MTDFWVKECLNKFLSPPLQQFSGYPGAGFGVGEGVVVVLQVIAAEGGDGVQLVVGCMGEDAAGGLAGAVETVAGIVHLIAAHDGPQAAFVECLVVGDEGQAFYQGLYLPPHLGEDGGFVGVGTGEAVHAGVPIEIVVGLGLDEGIEGVDELTVAHDDDADAAHAGALVVGGLEVDGGEIEHGQGLFSASRRGWPVFPHGSPARRAAGGRSRCR